MSKLATKILSQYQIDPASALGGLVALTCERTRFFGEESVNYLRPNRKALRRFRELLAEAMQVGVRPNAVKIPEVNPHPAMNPHDPRFRAAACTALEDAINRAKAAKFKGVREDDYSLREMRRIAAKSGSMFFRNLKPGERVNSLNGNIVYVRSGGNSTNKRFFKMSCETGTFEPIENPKLNTVKPVLETQAQ